jgi:hypothetical protein
MSYWLVVSTGSDGVHHWFGYRWLLKNGIR